jgi:hypothetical protein
MKKSPKRQNFDQSGHPGPEINFFNFNFFPPLKNAIVGTDSIIGSKIHECCDLMVSEQGDQMSL